MKQIFFIILATAITLSSCSSSDSIVYESLDTGTSESLQSRMVNDSFEFGFASKIWVYDSLLIVYDEMQEEKIQFFHKESGQHLASFGRIGQGDKELITPANGSVNKRTGIFSLYDYARGNLLSCRLSDYRNAWFTMNLPEYEVRPKEVIPVGTDDLVALHGRPRFTKAHQGEVTASFDQFPLLPEHPDEEQEARMFFLSQSLLAVKPDGEKMVQATTLGSIMQVFDLKESSIKPVFEKYFHQPIFAVQKGQIQSLPETIYGFSCLQATDRSIYATIHGVTLPTEFPGTVYQFDWKGKLQKRLVTDRQLVCFAVDEATEKIYAVVLGENREQMLVCLEPARA